MSHPDVTQIAGSTSRMGAFSSPVPQDSSPKATCRTEQKPSSAASVCPREDHTAYCGFFFKLQQNTAV